MENFSTTTGQHTNAVYGFTSMLINVLRDEQPTHVAVAFDVVAPDLPAPRSTPSTRPSRNKTPDEFNGQLPLIKEVLDALRIPYRRGEGYEADDIIATLATQAPREGIDVLICTGDRDAFQLVTDHVTVLYPMRGVSELARMTPEAVEAKYGVPPERYPELAALVGETSDNLPGVPGVGPKTAAKWINQYDGLDNVIAHADEIKGKAGETLREHLGDVHAQPPAQRAGPRPRPRGRGRPTWPRQAVGPRGGAPLFDGLEFRVLRDRLFETLEAVEEEADDPASSVDGTRARPPARCRLARRARGARRAGRASTWSARGPAAPARSRRSRSPTADGPAAWLDADRRSTAGRRRSAARLARRPGAAQGAARRQGADAGARRAGLAAAPA